MTQDSNYGLVVVGCGAAGLSAAVSYIESARAAGKPARVALVERSAEADRGGASRWTLATMRVDDQFTLDPRWVGQVQEASGQLSDLDFCLHLEQEAAASCNFLVDHGVELLTTKTPYEGIPPYRTAPNGGGLAIVDSLASYVERESESDIFYKTEAVKLSIDGSGRVNGVVVRGEDGLLRTLHAVAVVLACGGFEGNYEMLTQYVGKNAVNLRPLAPGTQYNKGDGIRMALEIGAATAGQFDGIHAELIDTRSDRPDPVLYGHSFTIAVNSAGERFYDEGATNYWDAFELIAYDVWANQDSTAYLITDDEVMSQETLTGLYETDLPPVKADTIPELALQLGLDPDALQTTIDEFNAACNDKPFDPYNYDGKATVGITPPKSNWASPINHPPYYGYPAAAAICFTYGGLKTDTTGRVLANNGAPIPSLYAAGELVGLFYHEYPAATSVLKGVTYGRIAGAHAAALDLSDAEAGLA